MRRLTLITALLAFFTTGGIAFGQKIKYPVTSTIADSDANFVPLSLQSDLMGSYQNGVSSVQSQNPGDWELSLLASPTLRVNVNFNDLVAGSNPDNRPTPPAGYYPVRLITQCGIYGFNLINFTSIGQTATCPLIVAVDIGSDRYSLRFHPLNFPGSDDISIECTSVTSGKCSAWRTQSPNGAGKLIAQVYKVTTSRGKTVLIDYGRYRFSFDMSFAKP